MNDNLRDPSLFMMKSDCNDLLRFGNKSGKWKRINMIIREIYEDYEKKEKRVAFHYFQRIYGFGTIFFGQIAVGERLLDK